MPEAKKSNITFILFSFNEGYRIEYAVRNLKGYGQVVVLDGGSTDNTKEVAEKFGARFVTRPKIQTAHVETPEMLEFAKSQVSTDWIYWGYVDNILPKTLLDKMAEISLQNKIKYVYIPVFTYLWGETKREVIRAEYPCFFKKGVVDFSENRIHGMGKFTGVPDETLHLPQNFKYAMRHFSLYDVNKFVNAHLRYANAEAEDKFTVGKRFSLTYLFGSMGHYFYLFYKRGWKLGIKGLYIALLYTFFRLMVAVKLYELEHGLNLETIESEYAKAKAEIIKDIES